MRADGKRLILTFGTLDVACVSTTARLDNEDQDADLLTFADVVAGNTERWFFTVSGYPDYSAGTFWSLLWETPAFTEIPYRFAPYGNTTPSTAQPHFTGTAMVDKKPPVGGDAGSAWTFDARLTCVGNPVRVTA